MTLLAKFNYTNHDGVRAMRTVFPRRLELVSENARFHAGCYCILAYCFDRKAVRHFALKDIENFTQEAMPVHMLREYQDFVGKDDHKLFASL